MIWRKVILPAAAACLFPYAVTLGWTGRIYPDSGMWKQEEAGEIAGERRSGKETVSSGRRIILDRDTVSYLDAEEYLIGAVAMQMPADYELEALKAQAVIARTYIYGLMGEEKEIFESALDMDYLEKGQMEQLWGTREFMEFYQKTERAVEETAGFVIQYEGNYIDPLFTRCTAGSTRTDPERPYLQSVKCPSDLKAEGCLQIREWTPEEFSRLVSMIPDGGPVSADQVPDTIQIGSRDGAGYVEEAQIGGAEFTGDELCYGLGLNSACFQLEDYEGKVRAIVKGIGHGYGFSQYEANEKAAEGWTWEELLTYFYQNISIVSV